MANDIKRKHYIYGIQCGEFIKVGVATDIAERLETMRLYNPHPCKLIFKRKTLCAYRCERRMHEILKAKAIGREWFAVTLEEVKAAAAIGLSEANKVFRKQLRFERQWQRDVVLSARAPDVQAPTVNSKSPLETMVS